ncbi:unnamed protein product [Heterobilharzia americana]|nr:unnamed protein product [Heterobilharzia americana]CAH8572518.1 unnamed protein product [Heterobilharzia americana]
MNQVQQNSSVPSTSSIPPHVENLSQIHTNSNPTSNHIIQEVEETAEEEEEEGEEEYDSKNRNLTHHHNPLNMNSKVCGAAFNTMPIYDPQGSLVGLQAPIDRNIMEEFDNEQKNESFQYNLPLHSAYHPHHLHPQYNLSLQNNPNIIIPNEYNIPYTAYTFNPHNHHLFTPLPCQPQAQQQPQYYQQNYPHIHKQQQQQQQQQQSSVQQHNHQQSHYIHQYQPQPAKTLLVRSASGIIGIDQNNYNNPEIYQPLASDNTFDKCPIVCSLFAIFCCPITIWCSVPALAYSLCAYTDYRTDNINEYRRKSDIARYLVITACLIGLLLCITWGILTFFYYELMLTIFNDIVRVITQRIRSGT